MANSSVLARSEQTQSLFLLASKAARKAARHWWLGRPTQTIVAWRDTACNQHCEGLPNPIERSQAFNDAFALELGRLIVGGRYE